MSFPAFDGTVDCNKFIYFDFLMLIETENKLLKFISAEMYVSLTLNSLVESAWLSGEGD